MVFTYGAMCPVDCNAQTSNYIFEYLTTEQGLSSNKVEAVLQDKEGFYWIATQNGLNRFDGTTFKIFRHDANDSTSLSHNYCTALVEGKNGDIWVATYKGVSRYIRSKGYFQTIYLQHPIINFEITNRIYDIAVDDAGTIWIGGNGLWSYDVSKDSIVFYQHSATDATTISDGGLITHLVYDQDKHGLWLTTGKELNFLDIPSDQFYSAAHNPHHWKVFDNADAREITLDAKDRLWFRDKKTQSLSYFETDINQITTTAKKINYGVKQIAADEKDRIWIFYWLADSEIYNPETGETDSDFFSVHHRHSMISKIGNALFIDKEGNHWISTGNGIGIYNEANQYYKIYQINVADKGNEQDPLKIKAMAQTERDYIWLATNLGLYKYNLLTGAFQHVQLNTTITNITTLCSDRRLLWIGIYDQLYGLDPESETIVKKYKTDPGIFFIQKGDHEDLWVGLWTGGLCRVNVTTNEITYFKKNTTLPGTIKSNNLIAGLPDINSIWVGYNAGQGFSKYSILDNSFTHYHPMENDSTSSNAGTITVITKDPAGDLWLGTHGSGIFRFDPEQNTYDNIQQQQGLNSNYINSILPDKKGHLWISTADGINYFNTGNSSIRKLTIDLVFSDNDFAANGIRGLDGKLYFFCNNQFIKVDPAAYHPDQHFPHLVLSGFKIFDDEIPISARQEKIDLTHRQNYFSFEYSAVRTNPLKEVHTAYMLEGFDKAWNETTHQQYAGYTNVPYGNYRFIVKAANEEGQWSDVLLSMAVHIRPPFWSTWWFALICVTVVFLGIYLVYQNRVQQIKRIFSLRNKISQDLHDDVGASLSSIQIYSAVAEKEMEVNPEKAREIVQQINQNSRQVMENMSDIVWAMNAGRPDGESLASRLKNYGYELLSQKNIDCQYKIDPQAERKLQKPDARKNILLIIKEALNNITKYSEASHAEIQIGIDGSVVFIRITDNGKGFDTNHVQSGNGLRNMRQRAEALGGTFNISSSRVEGTNIECRIPLTNISDR